MLLFNEDCFLLILVSLSSVYYKYLFSTRFKCDKFPYVKDKWKRTQRTEQSIFHVFHWTFSGLRAQSSEKQTPVVKWSCRCWQLTLSPSSTWQMTSSVAGLRTGNFLPLTESCHSLFMKICDDRKQIKSLKYAPRWRIFQRVLKYYMTSTGCVPLPCLNMYTICCIYHVINI